MPLLLGGAVVDCLSSHFPWFLSALLSGWVVFVLLVALFPFLSSNFSLQQSVNPRSALISLFRPPASNEQRMVFLDIFRIWAICWVISNHLGSEGRLDVLLGLPNGDHFKRSIHAHPILGPLFGNSALGVEIFLVLSGFLAARSWQRRWQPNVGFWRSSLQFLLHRWLRIAPTSIGFILLAVGTSQIVFPLFHQTMVSKCTNAQLIAHALLFNNWCHPTCFAYLWHLGLDWQCHLFVPFLLHLLSQRPKMGSLVVITLISGSMCLRGLKCVSNGICDKSDVDIPFVSVRPEHGHLIEMYTRPATKCGPFLVGLLFGLFSLSAHNSPHWLKMLRHRQKLIFRMGFWIAVACVYGILPEYWHPNQGVTLYNAVYTATFRTLFASGVGLMLIGCLFSPESTFRSAPTRRICAGFARLSFTTALVHMPIIFLFTRISLFQRVVSPFGLLVALPPAVLFSFTAACIFYCIIQWPIEQIVSRIRQ